MAINQKKRYVVLSLYMVALIVLGVVWPGSASFWNEYRNIVTASGVLITDFFEVGSIQTALVNAGLVGLMGLALIALTGTTVSGPTIAAVFTMAGFALFGKTPVNIWPIMLGVALNAWVRRERFGNILLVALFGTAIGPAVSQVSFGLGLGYPIGVGLGVLIGMLLPGLAVHLLHNHQGFNLYNVGFTCGVMGIYVVAHLKAAGFSPELMFVWGAQEQTLLAWVFTVYFASMLVVGWAGRRDTPRLWKLPGTLVTDFVTEQGFGASVFNMGLVGLIGMAYIALVGGEFNGPTLGGVFTMVGFAAFGKHVRNVWPIMTGVFIAAHISVWHPAEPGPLLAALFGTALAPIAGGFGPWIGILAGAVHLAVVMHVGIFHAGMNLYNNGFAAGLVGTLFVGVSRWFNVNHSD